MTSREVTLMIMSLSVIQMPMNMRVKYGEAIEAYFRALGVAPISDEEDIKALFLEAFTAGRT